MISDDIQVIQGSLGSGKSLVAVIEASNQLRSGGVVATNFSFSPNWAWDLAGQDLKVRLGWRDQMKLAQDMYPRCYKIGNPQSMIELSGDRGSNLAKLCTGKLKTSREGKGLLILDDCHHFFNSRTFTANKDYVTFFANARKYGWRTLLITHSIENIDKQIRSYVEIESRFRNLQKFRLPVLGLPLSPFPAFLIVRRYAGLGPGSGSIHSKDLYWFDKGAASLYDTLERFGESELDREYSLQGHPPRDTAKKYRSKKKWLGNRFRPGRTIDESKVTTDELKTSIDELKTSIDKNGMKIDSEIGMGKNRTSFSLCGQFSPWPQYYSRDSCPFRSAMAAILQGNP